MQYLNLASAKRAVKVYQTVLVALNGRTPDEAKNWLTRDAERAREAAKEFERVGNVAASQLDFNRRPVGRKGPDAAPWFAKANTATRNAKICESAADNVGVPIDSIQEFLQSAVTQVGEFIAKAEAEKGQDALSPSAIVHGRAVPLGIEEESELCEEYKKLSVLERKQFIARKDSARAKTLARLREIEEIGSVSSQLRRSA